MKPKSPQPRVSSRAERKPSFRSFLLNGRRDPLKIALAYAVIMLPIALIFHQPNDSYETDFFGSYAPQARMFLQNGTVQIEDFRGPFYPLLLAGARVLVGDYFRAGIVLSVLSAALLLGFLCKIATTLWSRSTALWSVALTACNPVFVSYSYGAGTDMMFAALSIIALHFILQDRGLPGGLVTAAAYLTRYNGIVLLLPALLSPKRWWIWGAFLVLMLPWSLHCLAEKGDFLYNKNYLNLAFNIYGEGRSWDDFWTDPALHERFTSFASVIAYDPARFAQRILLNILSHLVQDARDVIGIAQAILAAVGLLVLRPNPKQRLFFLFGLSVFVGNLFVFYANRFSLFLIPFYSVLAILGCEPIARFIYDKAPAVRGSGAVRPR